MYDVAAHWYMLALASRIMNKFQLEEEDKAVLQIQADLLLGAEGLFRRLQEISTREG